MRKANVQSISEAERQGRLRELSRRRSRSRNGKRSPFPGSELCGSCRLHYSGRGIKKHVAICTGQQVGKGRKNVYRGCPFCTTPIEVRAYARHVAVCASENTDSFREVRITG